MNLTALQQHTPIKARKTPGNAEGGSDSSIRDGVSLGEHHEPLPGKPNFAPAKEEKPVEQQGVGLGSRVILGGLAGLIGMGALTGCTKTPAGPPVVETQAQKEARQQFSQVLAQIEKNAGSLKGSGEQQSEQVTRQIMDAAKKYAQQSGKDGPGVVNDLRNLMVDHPALTITSLFALGMAGGVGLEKLGLTDGISQGFNKVYEAAKEHPFIATGIALAAAGGAAYLINELVTNESSIPAKPQGAQAQTLNNTFKSLEERLAANPNADAGDIHKSVYTAISKYQKDTGKPWEKVMDDVKAFAFDHPVLAASLVASAGAATGVVLERAGVPASIAKLAGNAFEGSKDAAGKMAEIVKEHPVISGAVAVAVASGVGYLAYQHFNAK